MKKILFSVLCLLVTVSIFAQNDKKDLHIIFIGNSITQGSLLEHPDKEAAPVKACEYLEKQEKVKSIKYINCGRSGATTVDFLPASQSLFNNVTKAADELYQKNIPCIFSIMIGTNDSAEKGPNGSPISPVQYYTNMKVIIDELQSLYPSAAFVLHYPIWYSPNTYNSSIYLQAGLNRLQSYHSIIDKLIADYAQKSPNLLFKGDTEGFEYFKANYETEFTPENGNAGIFYLHPNKSGATKLGKFWGKAIYNIVFP
ncbi:MAG: GDSL-type esterase/lipase family protein [Prevotella sp.]|jgi:lysophospholipase L1-like esterase|nr:GDSL-type esterase/lipase family protein [Prevotella sp.]